MFNEQNTGEKDLSPVPFPARKGVTAPLLFPFRREKGSGDERGPSPRFGGIEGGSYAA